MLDEIRKSVYATLYERTVSPFYGTFALSWLTFNWQLIYYYLNVEKNVDVLTKIDCLNQFINFKNTLIYPICSTIILLTFGSLISNLFYFTFISFKAWRHKKKLEIESKELMSVEKALEIREKIRVQEENFKKIIDNKNEEINLLSLELNNLRIKINEIETSNYHRDNPNPIWVTLFNNTFKNLDYSYDWEKIYNAINNHVSLREIDNESVAYFEANGIINRISAQSWLFNFSEKGWYFYKEYLNYNALKNK